MNKRFGIWALAAIVICGILAIAATAGAWTANEDGGIDIAGPAGSIFGDLAAKKAVTQQRLTFRNKSGSALAAGEPVTVDGTSITVVTATTGADAMTIAESLSSEGGSHYVMVSWAADVGSALTGTLTGTDQNGAVQTETITSAATGRCAKSSKLWKTIALVNMANLAATDIGVYAYPLNGITDAASNDLTCIGIATAAIADNAEGEVACFSSVVTTAKVMGPAVIPGDVLGCDGSQALDEDNTAPVAIALEPAATQTAELCRVLLMQATD